MFIILMFILTSLQVFTDGMKHQRVAERINWLVLFNTHQSPRQGHHSGYGASKFLAEVDDLNSIWDKSSSVPYAPDPIQASHWVPKV